MREQTQLTGKKIVLAGGGSGGHVFPVRAIAEQLLQAGAELLWIGAADTADHAATVAEELKIPFVGIPAGKWRRYLTAENLATPYRFASGVLAAYRALQKFQPDLVFGKGGFVSLPVILAAHRLSLPIVIHESDVVVGWANRLAARYAQVICVAFPINHYRGLEQKKLVFSGVPIGEDFFKVHKQRKTHKPQLFVTGASQGSVILNQAIVNHLDQLLALADIVHLTGPNHFGRLSHLVRPGYRVLGWAGPEMAQLMADSDIIVSRAGATTLAEIAAIGRPAILVPLASAANDHQLINATIWSETGAGVVLQEGQLERGLVPAITRLLENPGLRQTLANKAAALAQPNATTKIVEAITSVINS